MQPWIGSERGAVVWTKRMMLGTILSAMAWFTRAAAKHRITDINSLRDAVIEIVGRKPGVDSAVPDTADPARLIVRADGKTYTVDLTNLFNRIQAYPDEDPQKLITQFIDSFADLKKPLVSEENLVAVLRDKAYADQVSKGDAWTEPLVGELVIVYMADMPGSMSVVGRKQFPKRELADLRRIALGNVSKWLDHIKSDDRLQVATLYFVEGNTLLSPTLVLLDDFWTSIRDRYPGDVLIAVPRRDQLFIFNDDANGKAVARRLIDVTFRDNFSLLSNKLFARRNGKIIAVDG
jgi:uncharacterized protein YtpQ (UPF0354 family)